MGGWWVGGRWAGTVAHFRTPPCRPRPRFTDAHRPYAPPSPGRGHGRRVRGPGGGGTPTVGTYAGGPLPARPGPSARRAAVPQLCRHDPGTRRGGGRVCAGCRGRRPCCRPRRSSHHSRPRRPLPARARARAGHSAPGFHRSSRRGGGGGVCRPGEAVPCVRRRPGESAANGVAWGVEMGFGGWERIKEDGIGWERAPGGALPLPRPSEGPTRARQRTHEAHQCPSGRRLGLSLCGRPCGLRSCGGRGARGGCATGGCAEVLGGEAAGVEAGRATGQGAHRSPTARLPTPSPSQTDLCVTAYQPIPLIPAACESDDDEGVPRHKEGARGRGRAQGAATARPPFSPTLPPL